jgi:hypothetical protein
VYFQLLDSVQFSQVQSIGLIQDIVNTLSGIDTDTAFAIKKKKKRGLAPVTHTCNPSYSESRNQEDQGSKPALA